MSDCLVGVDQPVEISLTVDSELSASELSEQSAFKITWFNKCLMSYHKINWEFEEATHERTNRTSYTLNIRDHFFHPGGGHDLISVSRFLSGVCDQLYLISHKKGLVSQITM